MGLSKVSAGTSSVYLSITVENRRRPISISGAGIPVSCSSAWMAIGIDGVAVRALVGEKMGEGVMTNAVGGGSVAVGLSVGREAAVSAGRAFGSASGATGICGAPESQANTSSAIAPERIDSTSDTRARTMCRWRSR